MKYPKSEARGKNPKYEIRNKEEMSKEESTKRKSREPAFRFVLFSFGHLNLFRISCFGFRACRSTSHNFDHKHQTSNKPRGEKEEGP
jgi:hypothetical protein